MMILRRLVVVLSAVLFALPLIAAGEGGDSLRDAPGKKKIKKWNWIILPSLAYNNDIGFQYGLLGDVFYYPEGKDRADRFHNLYAEVCGRRRGAGSTSFSMMPRTCSGMSG